MIATISLLQLLLKKEVRILYPNRISFLFFIGGEVLLLWIYHLTSATLSPKIEYVGSIGPDYFSFIVIGHMTLLVPLAAMQQTVRALREALLHRTFDTVRTSSGPIIKNIFVLGFPTLVLRALHLIVVGLCLFIFFSWGLAPGQWLIFLSLQLIFLPTFIGIGFLAGSLVLWFGRGERWVFVVSNLAHVFAGVYFPTTALPKHFAWLVDTLSPFNLILSNTRFYLSDANPNWVDTAAQASAFGILFFGTGLFTITMAFKKYGSRKKPVQLLNP